MGSSANEIGTPKDPWRRRNASQGPNYLAGGYFFDVSEMADKFSSQLIFNRKYGPAICYAVSREGNLILIKRDRTPRTNKVPKVLKFGKEEQVSIADLKEPTETVAHLLNFAYDVSARRRQRDNGKTKSV